MLVHQPIALNEPAVETAQEFFQEINNPVLTNIETTWIGSGEAPEIYPLAAPDLFANQPLVLHGRKGDRANGKLKITGTLAGGKKYQETLDVNFNQVTGNSAIAQLWGRAKIKDLMTQMHWGETSEGKEAVTNTALAYNLFRPPITGTHYYYTSFVAVTEEVRVDPQAESLQEDVAVQLPKGMNRNQTKSSNNQSRPVKAQDFINQQIPPVLSPQSQPILSNQQSGSVSSSSSNSSDVPELKSSVTYWR